jgi:Ran GTPase-activating protein (RanGAP) involved in mRNA processing and transport
MLDLTTGSKAGSDAGTSKVSKGSAFAPPDDDFDVRQRRPRSPAGSTASFGSRRGSRTLVGPSQQQFVASALEAEAASALAHSSGDEPEQDKGVFALGALVAFGKETLEPLSLPDKRDPGFKNAVIGYLYSQHKTLTSLDMSDAGLVDSDVPRLSDAIGSNTVVKSVSLATNSLTHECMPDLVAGLERCLSLRAIDLGENAIGVRGAALLARNLDRKTQLIGLDLASNLIRDEGCRAVLDSLQQTPGQPIQWLSISENSISDHSAADIASLIDCSKNLTFLDLSRNSFFSNGMRVIAEELGLNQTLKHLNLSNIQLGNDAVELLASSVGINRGLISLDMYGCSMGDVGAKAIGAALVCV